MGSAYVPLPIWPEVLSPQQSTVPSARSAQMSLSLAWIETTPLSGSGTDVPPHTPDASPQQYAVPSTSAAQVALPPVLMVAMLCRFNTVLIEEESTMAPSPRSP